MTMQCPPRRDSYVAHTSISTIFLITALGLLACAGLVSAQSGPPSYQAPCLALAHEDCQTVTVKLVDGAGQGLPEHHVEVRQAALSAQASAMTDAGGQATFTVDGGAALVVEVTRTANAMVAPPAQRYAPGFANELVVALRQGFQISGLVSDADGEPIPGAYVKLVHPSEVSRPTAGVLTDDAGRYALVADPAWTGRALIVYAHADPAPVSGSMPATRRIAPTGDMQVKLSLPRAVQVSGFTRAHRPGIDQVTLLMDDRIVDSVPISDNGLFSFYTPQGDALLMVNDFHARTVPVTGFTEQDLLDPVAGSTLEFTLTLPPAFRPPAFQQPTFTPGPVGILTVKHNSLVSAEPLTSRFAVLGSALITGNGRFSLYTDLMPEIEGNYSLTLFGGLTFEGELDEASYQAPLELTATRAPDIVSLRFLDPEGFVLGPPERTYLDVLDGSQSFLSLAPFDDTRTVNYWSDSRSFLTIEGRHEGFASLLLRTADQPTAELTFVQLQGIELAQPNADWSLLWGSGDPDQALDFVILADGYTTYQEPYEDSNDNGRWDATVVYDLNGNGQFDLEPVGYFGDGGLLGVGDPVTSQVEPFTDLNGDGVRNFDERIRLREDAAQVALSILTDTAISAHRDAINIWLLRLSAEQAGYSVPDAGLTRQTALGVNSPNGFDFSVDPMSVDSALGGFASRADVRVVMLNNPYSAQARGSLTQANAVIAGGNANMTGVMNAGIRPLLGEYFGLASEVAGPSREYHREDEPPPNVSYHLDPELVPWRDLLPEGGLYPGKNADHAIGIYAGAMGYSRGWSRSTASGMMHAPGQPFSAVNERIIGRRLADASGAPDPALKNPEAGMWGNEAFGARGVFLERVNDALVSTWFVFDELGNPVWYQAAEPYDRWDWHADLLQFRWIDNATSFSLAGRVQHDFVSPERFYFSRSLAGPSGEPMQPLLFARGPRYSGWTRMYFDPEEPGWGLTLDRRGGRVVALLFAYNGEGLSRWLIGTATAGSEMFFPMLRIQAEGMCPACDGEQTILTDEAGSISVERDQDGLNVVIDTLIDGAQWQRETRLVPIGN